MKKLFLLSVAATLISSLSFATIRRVGYPGIGVTDRDYADLQSAHDAANANDTIYLYAGGWSANYSKKLTTIGAGYYLDRNPNLNITPPTSNVSIILYDGSDGSTVQGLNGLAIYPYSQEEVSDITISRCNATVYANEKTRNNWRILQSVINMTVNWAGGSWTNLAVNNCIITGTNMNTGTGSANTGIFSNNVFQEYGPAFGGGNFLVQNSVFNYISGYTLENVVFQNNIINSSYSGNDGITDANNNKFTSFDNYSVYVGWTPNGSEQNSTTPDSQYALSASSPAKGAGAGGTDAGIFGGNNPYKLSGVPAIPAFYQLTSPTVSTSTNPYVVTFSVRSNN